MPTFDQFARLPQEIQDLIWEFSLPGPRVLTLDHRAQLSPNSLSFHTNGQPPNPSALYICRSSRRIALKHYKLSFGNSNIYTDLPAGDILFIHDFPIFEWTTRLTMAHGRRVNEPAIPYTLAKEILDDLALVTHIAISFQMWTQYKVQYYGPVRAWFRRPLFEKFPGVKRVSLCEYSSNGLDEVVSSYPSITDPFFLQPQKVLAPIRHYSLPPNFWLDANPNVNARVEQWGEERKEILANAKAAMFLRDLDLDYRSIISGMEEERMGDFETRVLEMVPVFCEPLRVLELAY